MGKKHSNFERTLCSLKRDTKEQESLKIKSMMVLFRNPFKGLGDRVKSHRK
jgi:hypothetical protein